MPDKTLLRISRTYTFDDHVRSFILLVAGNDLVFTILAVGRIKGKELEQVHDLILRDHILHARLYCCQRAIRLIISCMPRTVLCSRHADGAITIAFTLCSEVKYVRYKHLRNTLLVFVYVLCSVQPCDSCTDRCLQLTDSKWEAIHQKNDIQTFTAFLLRINPLIRNNILVLVQLAINFSTKEVD